MDVVLLAEAVRSWQDVVIFGLGCLFTGFVAWLIFR